MWFRGFSGTMQHLPYHLIFGTTGLTAHHCKRKIELMNDMAVKPSLEDLDEMESVRWSYVMLKKSDKTWND